MFEQSSLPFDHEQTVFGVSWLFLSFNLATPDHRNVGARFRVANLVLFKPNSSNLVFSESVWFLFFGLVLLVLFWFFLEVFGLKF